MIQHIYRCQGLGGGHYLPRTEPPQRNPRGNPTRVGQRWSSSVWDPSPPGQALRKWSEPRVLHNLNIPWNYQHLLEISLHSQRPWHAFPFLTVPLEAIGSTRPPSEEPSSSITGGWRLGWAWRSQGSILLQHSGLALCFIRYFDILVPKADTARSFQIWLHNSIFTTIHYSWDLMKFNSLQ